MVTAVAPVALRAAGAFYGLVGLLFKVFLCFSLSSSGFPRHFCTIARPLEGPCDTSTPPAPVPTFYNTNGFFASTAFFLPLLSNPGD